jgi:hypothetical protein
MVELKNQKQKAILAAEFLRQNANNYDRQMAYLNARLVGTNQEILALGTKISTALAAEKQTENTTDTASGWWVFKNHTERTEKTVVKANSGGLSAQRKILEAEVVSIQKQMNDLTENQQKKSGTVPPTDTTGFDERIKDKLQQLRSFQNKLDERRQALLANKLATSGMPNDASKKILDIVLSLSFLIGCVGFITGQMDATREQILKVLANDVLGPGTVLNSIAAMFKFPVINGALIAGDLGMAGDPLFDRCYNNYLTQVSTVTTAAMTMTQVSVEKVLAKDTEVSAQKSAEQMAMELFG